MPDPTQGIDFAETQKIATNMLASTLCNSGAEALLDAQADLLKGVSNAMTEWLHRRQEAIAQTYRLVERMRESLDVSEIWKAQQEWAAAAMQRFAADVTAYPGLFATAGQRAGEALRQSATEAASDTDQGTGGQGAAVGDMARRAADITQRPAKLPKVPAEPKAPAPEQMMAH